MRRLFSRFDRTGSGLISKKDFQYAFGKMGLSATLQDVKDLLRRLDRNDDGLIDYGSSLTRPLLLPRREKRKHAEVKNRKHICQKSGGGFRCGR